MFIRKNKNRSGTVSIQIVEKINRINRIVSTVGVASTAREEELLMLLAKNKLEQIKGTPSLFVEHDDLVVENFVETLCSADLQIVGPELILAPMYQQIGYPDDGACNYFKALVLSRLVYPGSKLKTADYFKAHLNLSVSVYTIYRFLDELSSTLKQQIEQSTFDHTATLMGNHLGIVFYDMTSLYFEASEPDDFRVSGFSKDGKHQHPQILIGLLVSGQGYPIGYELFEGNTSESYTLLPMLQAYQDRFGVEKPIVIADSALLSQSNIDALRAGGYTYILGGRLKNEPQTFKARIFEQPIGEGQPIELAHRNGRLIISYSKKRAHKDKVNREKGLKRLEKRVKSGKLTKQHINNRGYNKYLCLSGQAQVSIDYKKFEADQRWDGLKGYLSNTRLPKDQIIAHYQQLWHIEKAFRISKTDLRIRPVYHRLKSRIEAHICICFAAYAVYKELERQLIVNKVGLSVQKALEEIKEIRQLRYILPKSKTVKTTLLTPNENQIKLLNMKI